jgi:hypothetical protein
MIHTSVSTIVPDGTVRASMIMQDRSDGYHHEFPYDPFHPTTCFTVRPHLVRLELFHPDGRLVVQPRRC